MSADTDPTVTLTQFTDPMCTWCWGSEPIVRHLETVYGEQLEFRFVMGGLIEDFDEFYDAANDISEPSEVGPHWAEAAERHGMPVDTTIFEEDPAQSTYPASVAYVAARQQDHTRSHRYLRQLREAYATQVRNINRREEQIDIAQSVGLDVQRFSTSLDDGSARAAFEEELSRTRAAGVRAFPTYRIEGPEGERQLSGFQTFEELEGQLDAVAPSLEASSPPRIQEFVAAYDSVATQEVAELYGVSLGKARQKLESFVDEGHLSRERRGNGYFWQNISDETPGEADS